jgi:hypothetical protein
VPRKDVEIEMVADERLMVIGEDTGAHLGDDLQRLTRVRWIIVHQDDYVELTLKSRGRNTLSGTQYRLHASTAYWAVARIDHIYPGEENRAAFQGDQGRMLYLPLRTRRRDDPLITCAPR